MHITISVHRLAVGPDGKPENELLPASETTSINQKADFACGFRKIIVFKCSLNIFSADHVFTV